MQVKSIAECSKGSILQYFRPSLSYHLSLRSLFCLFLSGRLRQVLLYNVNQLADGLLFMVCSGTFLYRGNMDPAKIYLVSHQEIG